MRKAFFTILFALVMFCLLSFSAGRMAHAIQIIPGSVSGTGTFNNSPGLIIDGTIPSEGTVWTASTNVWWSSGLAPTFTIDLGQLFDVQDIIISIDNNDSYNVDYSADNSSWSNLFAIAVGYGEIGTGMDTMATDNSHPEYISQLDFTSVNAQFLRVYATGGDGLYSISELQVFGTSTAVPEPATIALLGIGLAGLGGMYFRRKKILSKY